MKPTYHAQFMISSDNESAFELMFSSFSQSSEIYDDTSEVVGKHHALIPWDSYFANLLPKGVNGIACVASTCGQSFTYFLKTETACCS
jgi:hypothetical protein